jgi:hypothetical protein
MSLHWQAKSWGKRQAFRFSVRCAKLSDKATSAILSAMALQCASDRWPTMNFPTMHLIFGLVACELSAASRRATILDLV